MRKQNKPRFVNKVTTGFVIQKFDRRLGEFVSQEFVAGDETDYETLAGEPVESDLFKVRGEEIYLPFNMVQPSRPLQQAPRRHRGSKKG